MSSKLLCGVEVGVRVEDLEDFYKYTLRLQENP